MMSTNFKFYFDLPMEETKGNSTPDSLFTVPSPNTKIVIIMLAITLSTSSWL